jgi:hypothetical protein
VSIFFRASSILDRLQQFPLLHRRSRKRERGSRHRRRGAPPAVVAQQQQLHPPGHWLAPTSGGSRDVHNRTSAHDCVRRGGGAPTCAPRGGARPRSPGISSAPPRRSRRLLALPPPPRRRRRLEGGSGGGGTPDLRCRGPIVLPLR